jgi:hypothetical protein
MAGAVNIDFILYFLSTRWQYSLIFIMIYHDFFVPKLQDAFVPANRMAGHRFLGEKETDSLSQGYDENLSEFSFGE